MRSKKKPEHYVDNKEFLAALSEYKRNVQDALTEEAPRPMIPNYIGECFLKIAQHLSYRPNFINYPFREDMISDGIENCVQYIDNFDPDRGNPFAYFTQIIYYAFLRRIQKEKKQLDIKNKILEKTGYDQVFVNDNTVDNSNYADYNSIKDAVYSKLRGMGSNNV